MAYFECTIGGGDYEPLLIVTCSSEFAGLPITCSDGETTLIDNCPSTAPYEIEFSLPNYGEWTISGTVSGYTITESILVQEYEVELNYATDITVDLYSAANDTVSYIGTDGNTHTVTTDSTGHAVTTITGISPTTPSITFTSSVAKDPDNLSNAYSKSIQLTKNTTEVYVMPDNVFYWWGYDSGEYEVCNGANGWTGRTYYDPTYYTNYMALTSVGHWSHSAGISTPDKQTGTINSIVAGVTGVSGSYGSTNGLTAKDQNDAYYAGGDSCTSTSLQKLSYTTTTPYYLVTECVAGRAINVYAMWKS